MNQPASPVLLSVVMPVYNEVATVRCAVERVRSVALDLEIVCIDDGSTDGSTEVLADLLAQDRIDRLVRHERNRGKGAAVRTGIQVSRGQLIVVQDADLEYDPEELPRLLQPILDGRADAVYGTRFLHGSAHGLGRWHRLGNRLLTRLSNRMTRLQLTDMETGYKMVRAPLLRSLALRSRRFGIEPEITAKLARAGARVVEIPIAYQGRTYAQGKKIGWRDGLAAVWHILRSSLPEGSFVGGGAVRHPELGRDSGSAGTRPPADRSFALPSPS